jgi:hypothetical protein
VDSKDIGPPHVAQNPLYDPIVPVSDLLQRQRDFTDKQIGILNAIDHLLNMEGGLPETCAANFDNIQTVPKANISAAITHLSASTLPAAAGAIGFALGFID